METPLRIKTEVDEKGIEKPLSFFSGEREIEIMEIIDRWYDQDYNYYKVLSDDGTSYLLRHNLASAAWERVETPEPSEDVPQ